MKLNLDKIKNKHKNFPCVVSLHGPSMETHRDVIQNLQVEKKVLRISTNEWWEYFKEKPDYLVVSNGELNIQDSFNKTGIFCPQTGREYPNIPTGESVLSMHGIPLFYNMTADLTDPDFVKKNLTVDYLPYDTKHFKNEDCLTILNSFRKHFEDNKNLNFKKYGNNSQMWQFPDVKDPNVNPYCAHVHSPFASTWSRKGRSPCCERRLSKTLQEFLQDMSGHDQHMGPGQTVGLYCIAFAIIMGCSPIYISGLDLDYGLGYAEPDKDLLDERPQHHMPNIGNVGHWKYVFKDFLRDDIRILNESAKLLGTEIINLNKKAWYSEFTKGDLTIL
jgi:hypothetical protein